MRAMAADEGRVTDSRQERYPALDGLRGLAAVGVVLFHFARTAAPWLAPSAHLAVDLFFLLSGFVIAQAYGQRLLRPGGFRAFIRTRLIRLWPLHLLGAAIGLAFFARGVIHQHGFGVFAATAAAHLAMLPTPKPWIGVNALFPFNIAAWSLFFEVTANLAYAALLPWLGLKRLIAATAVFGGLLIWGVLDFGSAGVGAGWNTFLAGFARVGFSFTLGVLMQRLWAAEGLRLQLSSALAATAAAVLMLAVFSVPAGTPGRAIYELVAIIAAWPALLALGLNIRFGPAVSRLAGWAGELSYPLYALHLPIALLITRETREGFPTIGNDPLLLMLLKLVVVAAAAWLAVVAFDRPVRAWLVRLGTARRPPARDPASA